MNALSKVAVEVTVVLGKNSMPIKNLLKMGRGAIIDLDAGHEEQAWIYANGELIARGEVMMIGEKIGVSITEMTQTSEE